MKAHLLDLMRAADPLQGRNRAREYLQARILGVLQKANLPTHPNDPYNGPTAHDDEGSHA